MSFVPKIQSHRAVDWSEIFDGLKMARTAFCEHEGYSFSWGDNNRSLVDTHTFIGAIEALYDDNGGDESANEGGEFNTARELKEVLDRVRTIPKDVYIDLEN